MDIDYFKQNYSNLKEKFGARLKRVLRQAEICREAISQVHEKVSCNVPADRALSAFLRKRKELGSRDRRLLYDLTFSLFRWSGWTRFAPDKADMDRDFLASLILDGKTDHSIAILWAIQYGLPDDWRDKIHNASLETRCDMLSNWLGFQEAGFKLENLFPEWFLDELFIPESEDASRFKNELTQILQSRSPTWIRFGDEIPVEKYFGKPGPEFHRHPVMKGAGCLSGPVNLDLIEPYKKGKMEVQDLSSQCVAQVCDPRPGDRWWDVCAGAGGKTLHLAQLMRGKGGILATDKRSSALKEARKRCSKWGYSNIRFQNLQHEEEGKKYDGILIDAPCSGAGTWRRNPDARWRTKVPDIDRYVKIQGMLLKDYSGYVKPGGVLIYSVCSLLERETVEIAQDFYEKHPEFEWRIFKNPLNHEKVHGMLWLWPQDHNCDGMFIAKFSRLE